VRGSTGYGKTFTKLDDGFLRQDSYNDINSLFDWIVTQPDLDSDRVAVMGGSYGGHMTLAISTFYSDRIRCSIDFVGMPNLVTFLEHTEAYRRDLRRVEYGDERDPKTREFLEKIAPMNNLEKIKKPMVVVAGKNDPRVPVSESDQIVAALKKTGHTGLVHHGQGRGPRLPEESKSGVRVLREHHVPAAIPIEVAGKRFARFALNRARAIASHSRRNPAGAIAFHLAAQRRWIQIRYCPCPTLRA